MDHGTCIDGPRASSPAWGGGDTDAWLAVDISDQPAGGGLAIALALWLIPRVPREPDLSLDVAGFLLSAVGLGAILFGLSCLGEHLVSTLVALGTLAVGAVLMAILTEAGAGP